MWLVQSGAGKSTFIKLMYREEKASKGTLNVAGHRYFDRNQKPRSSLSTQRNRRGVPRL